MTKDEIIKLVERDFTAAFLAKHKARIEEEAERRLAFFRELEVNPPEL